VEEKGLLLSEFRRKGSSDYRKAAKGTRKMQDEEDLIYWDDRLYQLTIILGFSAMATVISLFAWPNNDISYGLSIGFIIATIALSVKWWANSKNLEIYAKTKLLAVEDILENTALLLQERYNINNVTDESMSECQRL
jgi:hypothetical protein